MRLSLSVNGAVPIIASLSGAGYLSAHLNMSDRPKENEHSKNVRISGTETRETENVRLKWPTIDLETGDIVELRILPDGEGDVPSEVRKSSESPYNLFASAELARDLLEAVSEFEGLLASYVANRRKQNPLTNTRNFVRPTPL